LVLSLALISAQSAFSSNSGGYAGFGLGISSLGAADDALATSDSGFAGRFFLGYNFNEVLGIEGAVASLHDQDYALAGYSWIIYNYKLSALSLVGKVYLPVGERFNLNLSLGGAKMYTDVDETSVYNSSYHYKKSSNMLTGVVGFGAGFDVTEHLKTTLDLMVYGKQDGDQNHFGVPQSTLFTLGLAYKF
jgi:hypothetical protein